MARRLCLLPLRSIRNAVEDAERAAIQSALARADGAIGKAADLLGISRKNLWEKMRRYDMERYELVPIQKARR